MHSKNKKDTYMQYWHWVCIYFLPFVSEEWIFSIDQQLTTASPTTCDNFRGSSLFRSKTLTYNIESAISTWWVFKTFRILNQRTKHQGLKTIDTLHIEWYCVYADLLGNALTFPECKREDTKRSLFFYMKLKNTVYKCPEISIQFQIWQLLGFGQFFSSWKIKA